MAKTNTTDGVLGQRDDHPSYGVIELTKTSAGGRGHAMVGSPLKHHSLVHLVIKSAEKHRKYGKENFYGDKIIVDLYMTEHQWAEHVSSFGMGSGVPVTLNYKPADGYSLMACGEPPHNTAQASHSDDVEKAVAKAKGHVDQLAAVVGEMTQKGASKVKASDLQALRDATIQVQNWLSSNLPFVQKCFEEAMEKTVASAKAEVVGFTSNMLMRAGLESLTGQAPVLEIDDQTVR